MTISVWRSELCADDGLDIKAANCWVVRCVRGGNHHDHWETFATLKALLCAARYLLDWPDGVGMAIELSGDEKRLHVVVKMSGNPERVVSTKTAFGSKTWQVDWQRKNLKAV